MGSIASAMKFLNGGHTRSIMKTKEAMASSLFTDPKFCQAFLKKRIKIERKVSLGQWVGPNCERDTNEALGLGCVCGSEDFD